MSIAENVAIGRTVEQVFYLFNDDFTEKHWERLRDVLLQRHPLPVPAKQQPMTDAEVKRYELEAFPFGAHCGKKTGDVPIEYLDWLCRTQEDFYRDLRRYLLARNKENRDEC